MSKRWFPEERDGCRKNQPWDRGNCETTLALGRGEVLEVASAAKGQGFYQSILCDEASMQAQRRDLENVRTGEHVMMDKRDGGSSSPFPMLSLCILHRAVPEPCPAITTRDAASKVLL